MPAPRPLIRPSTVQPSHDLEALTYLHGRGCRFLFCTKDKTPMKGQYWRSRPRPPLDEVLWWGHYGGVIAIVPATLGLSAVDVDHGDPTEIIERFPPLVAFPSGRPGRMHLYYQDDRPRPNYTWEEYGCEGQIRSGNGYIILHGDGALLLARALMQPPPRAVPFWHPAHQRKPQQRKPQQPDEWGAPERRHGTRKGQAAPKVDAQDYKVYTSRLSDNPPPAESYEKVRNYSVFDAVRFWAYRQRLPPTEDEWYEQVRQYAVWIWRQVPDKRDFTVREAEGISRSVAGYVWEGGINRRRYNPHIQAAAGRLSRHKHRRKPEIVERNTLIFRLRSEGRSLRQIASDSRVAMSVEGVRKVLRRGIQPDL